MAARTAQRAAFSPSQLDAYFEHVRLPIRHRVSPSNPHFPSSRARHEFLRRLQQYQLATIPWENLSKHYSRYNTPTTAVLRPDDLFEKIVGSGRGKAEEGAHGRRGSGWGGRGGGCLENNAFFGTVMRSLGFDIYSGGARVRLGSTYMGWGHMVNFVKLEDGKHVVDVGFGASGPTHPLPLVENTPSPNIHPAEVRLIKSTLPAQLDSQKMWVYQHRKNRDAEWTDIYAFTETEFLPQDYEIMTVATTFMRASFFAYSIAMHRMVMAREVPDLVQDAEDEIVGEITMSHVEVKRRIKGKVEVLATFATEADRLEALRMWFGIEFSEAEQAGVMGTAVGLGSPPLPF